MLRECSAVCKGEELRVLWSVRGLRRLRLKLMLRLMLEQLLWLMVLLHGWGMLECSCKVRLS